MSARDLWHAVTRSADHRGGLRTAVTNRGDRFFVLCRCGWRSRLYPTEDHAWIDHAGHTDRHGLRGVR